MGRISEKERLIGHIVGLRRAERLKGAARDEIAAVRADLEEMAGDTATRAVAARLLSVSQTALDRWIAAGEVPVVITRSGRHEIPVRPLVELIGAVRDHRLANPEDPHPLGSVLGARRSQAGRLDTARLLNAADRRRRGTDGHRHAELRGLAYHRAVARRLDEQMLEDARERLARWFLQDRIHPRYAGRWREILNKTPAQTARLISEDSSRMVELRQSSPFAGALSEPERRRALAAIDEALS